MVRIRRLLIANRGEIVRRVARTASVMGISTVAVYSDPDRRAPHVNACDLAVPLGGARAEDSYLDMTKLLDAARRTGADAVHPGYGFLSENADFAEACIEAGLCWVGPTPEAMRAMALKVEAKARAAALGVPLLASATIEGDDPAVWVKAAYDVGYPLLVKASAGGGGRGMRLVEGETALADAVRAGRREAAASFGNGIVFVERYLQAPRHVEIQLIGDAYGSVLHLHERECSVQRRHQKVIEEATAPSLAPEVRALLADAAVRLAAGIGYTGAGTVEFLVEGDEVAFLEMNARLQVEHPVTEEVLGLDLVRLQLEVAAGRPLRLAQEALVPHGHAIEARLYAEDVPAGYLPAAGVVGRYRRAETDGIRYDDALEDGTVVSPYYDPMLAKVVAHAPTREEAALRLAAALERTQVAGVTTNRDLLIAVLRSDAFLDGPVTTAFLESHPELVAAAPSARLRRSAAMAATFAAGWRDRSRSPVPASVPAGWRNVRSQPQHRLFADRLGELDVRYRQEATGAFEARVDGEPCSGEVVEVGPVAGDIVVELETNGERGRWTVTPLDETLAVMGPGGTVELVEVPLLPVATTAATAGGPTAPLPGTVVQIAVGPGQAVRAGDPLVVLEAMKMEHTIRAHDDGVVEEVLVTVGASVDARQLLLRLRPPDDSR